MTEKFYLNMPGPSGVGRDFILESLLKNPPGGLDIKVLPKVTTRESRTTELTKRPISEQEFDSLLSDGKIIASYVLESNGKRYGYEINTFDIPGDIIVADASVYQTPELKKKFGDNLYSIAVVAPREYREKNIRSRISKGESQESEEEVIARLNLGDAHVVLLTLMAGQPYKNLVDKEFAANIDVFMKHDDSKIELIEKFCDSKNVVNLLTELRDKENQKLIEDIFVCSEKYRIPRGENVVGSLLWNDIMLALNKAINKSK